MQNTILILRESLQNALDRRGCRLYDDRETRSIIDLLLDEVCQLRLVDRILLPDRVLSASQRERLASIAKQLQQGIPVQQALGYAWFCGARFQVTDDVLIPRPETAELVDWIVSDSSSSRICDIGTGSGCIALSLARLINNSQVLAVDLSTAALEIAKQNAFQQHVDNVQFAQIDILKLVDNASIEQIINRLSTLSKSIINTPHKQGCQHSYQQLSTSYPPFDVVVSNPPYICRSEAEQMSDIVLDHEPDMALFVPDADPLLFYRAIARFALATLTPGGNLYYEINAAYGQETCQLLRDLGYRDVELRQDVNGRDRMIKATR